MKNFILTFLILNSSLALSQTYIAGGIFNDEHWTISGSPYILTGDIAIFNGNTLFIDPGVEIKVDGDYSFYIRGEIILNGTSSNPIIFKANSITEESDFWSGLVFENIYGSDISLNHVHIENARHAINIDQHIGSISINNCFIRYSEYGLDFYNSSNSFIATVNNSFFENVTHGVWFADSFTMQNCHFSNGEKAVYGGLNGTLISISNCSFDNFTGSYTLNIAGTLLNSTISNCHRGVRLRSNLIVTDCHFSDNNIATEITTSYTTSTMTSTTFCNNTTDIKHFYSFDINMANNCWCESDPYPSDGIIDAYDDLSLGIITYLPLANNCTSTFIEVYPNFFDDNLILYPNPANQEIFINTEALVKEINITRINGQTVKTIASNSNYVNVSDLPSGVYLVKLLTEEKTLIKKFVKQ